MSLRVNDYIWHNTKIALRWLLCALTNRKQVFNTHNIIFVMMKRGRYNDADGCGESLSTLGEEALVFFTKF